MFGFWQVNTTAPVILLLSVLLSACGGGSPEGGGPLGTGNSEAPPAQTSTSKAEMSSSTQSSSLSSSRTSSSRASSLRPSSQAVSSAFNEFGDDLYLPIEDGDSSDLPPSTPKSLVLRATTSNSVLISWEKSTDDIGLSHYEVRRDGIAIGTVGINVLEFEDSNLKANTYYTYTVRAIDIMGHRSNFSNSLIAKTSFPGANTSSPTSSSAPAVGSASSMSSQPKGTNSSQSQIANSSAASTGQNLRVTWATPSQRENGDYLELSEIGGYEIRYKPANSSNYISEIIADNKVTQLQRQEFSTNTIVLIAAFDTNGLYSRFVQLMPK